MEAPVYTAREPWTTKEVSQLVQLYPDHNNEIVALAVGRSVSAVALKAHRLGLKKSEKFLNSSQSGRFTVKVSLFKSFVNYLRSCFRSS